MLGLPIVPLSEIKRYVVVLSFYIKMMKRKTLQACSFKTASKKACFLFRANWTYLSRAGGSAHPLATRLPWQCLFLLVIVFHKNLITVKNRRYICEFFLAPDILFN